MTTRGQHSDMWRRGVHTVPGGWELQWAVCRLHSRSQNQWGGAGVAPMPPLWRPGTTISPLWLKYPKPHEEEWISEGTYSSYGHEDIHCPRSHCDILDVILFHSSRGIDAICVVIDLRREREVHYGYKNREEMSYVSFHGTSRPLYSYAGRVLQRGESSGYGL